MRIPHHPITVRLALLVGLLLAIGLLPPQQIRASRLASGAPWVPLFESDFTANAPAGWPTAHGASYDESVAGGRYILRVADGVTHLEGPHPPLIVSDGQITAIVRLNGHGQVGLAARMDQTFQTGYAFWIDRSGRCGAARFMGETETTLFAVYDSAIFPNGDNVLTMQIVGDLLTFMVNGRAVYTYTDQTPLPAGNWGMYASSEPGTGSAQGQYARVTLYGAPQSPRQPTLSAYPFHPMIDYDFSTGDNYSWYTSHFPHTSAVIAHGRLTISAIDNYTLVVTPRQFPNVANGEIAAVVRLRGAGRVGVAGRWTYTLDGHYTNYACWMDQSGDIGLTRENDGDRATVFEAPSSHVHPYQDTTLALRIRGNHVNCFANGLHMVVYSDPHPLAAGGWGAWVSDYPGGAYAQGQYRHVLIAD